MLAYGARVIEFMDGPLQGEFHEVENGFPCPDRMSVPDATAKWEYIYDIDSSTGRATFVSEGVRR